MCVRGYHVAGNYSNWPAIYFSTPTAKQNILVIANSLCETSNFCWNRKLVEGQFLASKFWNLDRGKLNISTIFCKVSLFPYLTGDHFGVSTQCRQATAEKRFGLTAHTIEVPMIRPTKFLDLSLSIFPTKFADAARRKYGYCACCSVVATIYAFVDCLLKSLYSRLNEIVLIPQSDPIIRQTSLSQSDV